MCAPIPGVAQHWKCDDIIHFGSRLDWINTSRFYYEVFQTFNHMALTQGFYFVFQLLHSFFFFCSQPQYSPFTVFQPCFIQFSHLLRSPAVTRPHSLPYYINFSFFSLSVHPCVFFYFSSPHNIFSSPFLFPFLLLLYIFLLVTASNFPTWTLLLLHSL